MGGLTLLKSALLLDYDPNILLDEQFSGSNLNESIWTKTDTQAGNPHISVSGGNLVIAAPPGAWVNTSLVSKAPHVWARSAGLTIEWQVTPGAITTFMQFGFCSSAGPGQFNSHGFAIRGQGAGVVDWVTLAPNAEIASPYTYSAATSYWWRIVLLATGALYYVSSDNRATWKIIWADATVTTTPLYAFIESYNAALTADRCRVLRLGVPSPVVNAVSQTVTPSEGAELIGNVDMSSDTWWSKDADWAIAAGVATHTPGSTGSLYRNSLLTVGTWYLTSFDVANYVAGVVALNVGSVFLGNKSANGTYVAAARCAGTGNTNFSESSTFDGAVDNVSIKPLTLSSLLGANQTARKEALWDCAVSGLTSGYQAGMWVNTDGLSDGNQDAIEVIIDRAAGTFRVSKYVAGTLTNNLISSAVTYQDGCVLRAERIGNSVAFYYAQDGTTFVQVGTTQTISDSTVISENGFRSFATDSAATMTLTCRGGEGIA